MSGDKMYDDHRYSDNRGDFELESTITRAGRTADIAAVLRTCSPGEMAYIEKLFAPLSAADHKGINGLGHALLLMVDAEHARRELDRAKTLAQFDAMAAELRPEPSDADMTGIPPWSAQ